MTLGGGGGGGGGGLTPVAAVQNFRLLLEK